MGFVNNFVSRQQESAPIQEIGIGGFTALARVEEVYTLKAKGPTTYLEDGSFAGDNITLDPLTLQINGSVSDLFIAKGTPNIVQRVQSEIGNISQYLPARSISQIQKINGIIASVDDKYREAESALSKGKQALEFFGVVQTGVNAKPLREQFVDAMDALHYGKQLVTIDMPYRRHDSMLITSVEVMRDNKNEALSFKISAQKVRIASTEVVQVQRKKPAPGQSKDSTSSEESKGTQEGKDAQESRSLLKSIFG